MTRASDVHRALLVRLLSPQRAIRPLHNRRTSVNRAGFHKLVGGQHRPNAMAAGHAHRPALPVRQAVESLGGATPVFGG